MKVSKALSVFPLVLLWSSAALAQDPVKVDPTHYKVLLDNPSVRVLKVDYAPGAKSTMHQHPDSIVDSAVGIEGPVQPSGWQVRGRGSALRIRDVHACRAPTTPTNIGKGRVEAVLVEFKAPKPGTATIPTSRAEHDDQVAGRGSARRRAFARRPTRRSRSPPGRSTTSIRSSSPLARQRCRWRSTASRRRRPGHAATSSSSGGEWRTSRRTPAASLWIW